MSYARDGRLLADRILDGEPDLAVPIILTLTTMAEQIEKLEGLVVDLQGLGKAEILSSPGSTIDLRDILDIYRLRAES